MTWEIFLGIVALVSFVITIGKLISNNTKALTSLQITCEKLDENDKEQKVDIKEIHSELENHETRITVLEQKQKEI